MPLGIYMPHDYSFGDLDYLRSLVRVVARNNFQPIELILQQHATGRGAPLEKHYGWWHYGATIDRESQAVWRNEYFSRETWPC